MSDNEQEPKMPLADTPIMETYYRSRAAQLQTQWQNAASEEEAAQIRLDLEPLQNWIAKLDDARNKSKERQPEK